MTIHIEDLGLTPEELQERVVNGLCDRFMDLSVVDDEGNLTHNESPFAGKVRELVRRRIDRRVAEICEVHVLPKVTDYIERLTLQETNQWGEARRTPVTFIEYLTQRAEAYLTEKVDFQGKTRSESGGYSWTATQTRIAHMIHAHLHYAIEGAMKNALSIATSGIAEGLKETVKLKLEEVVKSLQVKVATR